jgi:hypothetical protein
MVGGDTQLPLWEHHPSHYDVNPLTKIYNKLFLTNEFGGADGSTSYGRPFI